jgi:hypothetical protein
MSDKFWIVLYCPRETLRYFGTSADLSFLKSELVLSPVADCPLANAVYFNVLGVRKHKK